MKLIKQGAEAKLFKSELLGKTVLLKERVKKAYRNPELEKRINKSRIKKETLMLKKAREIGVRTPIIYEINLMKGIIAMEFIEGKTMKKLIDEGNTKYLNEIGKKIGLMHSNNLIHGDLTTSNILVQENELVFIDFGLGFESSKLEDKAVDLVGFKKVFTSSHAEMENKWNEILKGYAKTNKKWKNVEKQMNEVEKRIRYA
ncbi:MAG: KEOPS complex kinase/ATPase Bud32 [Candidatus Diapherotrites archaeon]